MICITTLGRPSCTFDGNRVDRLLAHRQKFALLTYIAIEGPLSRDRLLHTFWPERHPERARHSLSQAIYALRQELCEPAIQIDANMVSTPSGLVTVDTATVEEAAEDERWEEVARLYAGPFLDQFHLPGVPEFEGWQSRMRMRLERLAQQAFSNLVNDRLSAGAPTEALSLASRWARLQPLEDEAQHALIALLAKVGDRTGALQQYESFRENLAQTLEVEPLDETVELVEHIRAGGTPETHMLTIGRDTPANSEDEGERGDGHRNALAVREPTDDESEPEIPVGLEVLPNLERLPGGWRRVVGQLRRGKVVQVTLLYLGDHASQAPTPKQAQSNRYPGCLLCRCRVRGHSLLPGLPGPAGRAGPGPCHRRHF